MAVVIKAMNTIRSIYGEKTKLLLLKSIILSHFHYLFLSLLGMKSNYCDTLEQQVNWALKIYFVLHIRFKGRPKTKRPNITGPCNA